MIKYIRSYLYILLSVICILIFTCLLVLNLTIFRLDYISNYLDNNNYYEKIYKDIKTEMSYYTEQSGFNDDIIDNIFSIKSIKIDINKYLNDTYKGKISEIDTNTLKDSLENNIDNYLDIKHFIINDRSEIDIFIDKMSEIYVNKIKVFGDKLIIIKSISIKSKILMFGIVNLFIMLMILNKHKYLDIIMFVSSFIFIGLYLYIVNKIDINNLLIYSRLLSIVFIKIFKDILNIILRISFIYFVLGIIILFFNKNK